MSNLAFDFGTLSLDTLGCDASTKFPVRASPSLSDERKAELAWQQLPGKARWQKKTLEIMIHPEKLMRGMAASRGIPHSSQVIGIRFRPVMKDGIRIYKAKTLRFDFTEGEARTGDITWVSGRSWEGGGEPRIGLQNLLNYVQGKCSSCWDGHGFPNLFDTQFGETFY